jgi:hypothetical protein
MNCRPVPQSCIICRKDQTNPFGWGGQDINEDGECIACRKKGQEIWEKIRASLLAKGIKPPDITYVKVEEQELTEAELEEDRFYLLAALGLVPSK